MRPSTMHALAVTAHVADSLHPVEVPMPSLEDVPDGRGVLVRGLQVGIDGTDREIIEAVFGEPPPGSDILIISHENLGELVAVGPHMPPAIRPGGLVVSTADVQIATRDAARG